MSKFLGINYPFFGLIKKPYKVIYTLDKILIKKHENSHNETVDDKTLSGDYFSRLVNIDNRLKFNYTCRNLQDVLISNIKWGIDCKGIPHDLSVKETIVVNDQLFASIVHIHNEWYIKEFTYDKDIKKAVAVV